MGLLFILAGISIWARINKPDQTTASYILAVQISLSVIFVFLLAASFHKSRAREKQAKQSLNTKENKPRSGRNSQGT